MCIREREHVKQGALDFVVDVVFLMTVPNHIYNRLYSIGN